jgi:hypothetical protein
VKKLFESWRGYLTEMPREFGPIFDQPYGGAGGDEVEEFKNLSREEIEREKKFGNLYCQEDVCWIGKKGRMIKVDLDYVYPIQGNIFYQDKLDYFKNLFRTQDEVYLHAPYGILSIVDLDSIKESIEYEMYSGDHKALTTGDEELDVYILDKEKYVEDNDLEEEEVQQLEQDLQYAIANNEGDLGDTIFQSRDGNHRIFGARAAGKKYIWAIMYQNQYDDVMGEKPWMAGYKKYLK